MRVLFRAFVAVLSCSVASAQIPIPGGLAALSGSRAAAPPPADECESAVTTIEILSCGMEAGEFLQLTGADEPAGLGIFTGQAGSSGFITGYATKMAYDPIEERIYFIGADHSQSQVFAQFDLGDHEWTELTPTPFGGPTQHGYEHNLWANGTMYFRLGATLSVYRWEGGGTWTEIEYGPELEEDPLANSITWFPELSVDGNGNGAIVVYQNENGNNGEIIGLDPVTDDTQSFAAGETLNENGTLHTIAHYSPTHQIVWFGGGNGADHNWRLNSNGTVTALDDTPGSITVGAGDNQAIPFLNPANGNFIVCDNAATWYDFAPMATGGSQWTTRSGTCEALAEPTNLGQASWTTFGTVAVTLEEYGIVVFIKSYNVGQDADMWLFKP